MSSWSLVRFACLFEKGLGCFSEELPAVRAAVIARPRCAPRSGVPMSVLRVELCPSVGSCLNGVAVERSRVPA